MFEFDRISKLGLIVFVLVHVHVCWNTAWATDDDDAFRRTRGTVPDEFTLNQRYPDRGEVDVCRPIRLRIARNSRRFHEDLVVNTNTDIDFTNGAAQRMTSRMQTRLNSLASLFYDNFGVRITVIKAWTEYGDVEVQDPHSLHYEGRTVRVHVDSSHTSSLLRLAVQAGFDWVYYASVSYVRLSVIPDACDAAVDLVFMLDQSGSVGRGNHAVALRFIQDVVVFFNISANTTQVGLVTYSTAARIEFDLDEHHDLHSLLLSIQQVFYTGGYTATALALTLARLMLDPLESHGARPVSEGIPRVAVLITDGMANTYPITTAAPALQNSGVQVYTVGIGDVFLPELLFIASDPDPDHVFLLDSFSDAAGFVDLLRFTTCDTPAILDPGENTTSEMDDDEFRYFQIECAAFSVTVLIEQTDHEGSCSLYASTVVQHPGPLDPPDVVVKNEDHTVQTRFLHLNTSRVNDSRRTFIYVSVLGVDLHNTFSIIVWDMIFQEDNYTIYVPEGIKDVPIFELLDEARMTNETFEYTITEGNEEDFFELDRENGTLYIREELNASVHGPFLLKIVAQNVEFPCHRGRVKVTIVIIRSEIVFPDMAAVSIREDAGIGSDVVRVQAIGPVEPLEYTIVTGNVGNAFRITPFTGEIIVNSSLDFETLNTYTLIIQAVSTLSQANASTGQIILIEDVNEQPFFITQCAINNSCIFSVSVNQPLGTSFGSIEADDPDLDSTANGTLSYSLFPNSVPFTVGQDGDLRTAVEFSNDQTGSHTFRVIASDGGSSPLSVETTVTVIVGDESNPPPHFPSPCSSAVFENMPLGSTVIQCTAIDFDESVNIVTDRLTYAVVDGDFGGNFAFDPSVGLGVIVNQRNLDREEQDGYTLTISATDEGGLSAFTTVNITILDRNDNAPQFINPPQIVTITTAEILSHDTEVTMLFAQDADIGTNAQILFSIANVSQTPGNLETLLTVQATDMGSEPLSSTTLLAVQYEAPCTLTNYSIDPSSGLISNRVLCSVNVLPPEVNTTLNGSQALFCNILRNIDTTYQWIHNGSFITTTIPLPPSEPAGDLVILGVDFRDAGEYACKAAATGIGSLQSSTALLRVQVPPVITSAPEDQTVELGGSAEFSCFATGIPDPTIAWLRPAVSGEQPVQPSSRVMVMQSSLSIVQVQEEDQGEYICAATNPAGEDRASAMLIIFVPPDVVIIEMENFSNPNPNNTCNDLNSMDFDSAMSNITGHIAMTTGADGEYLCNQTVCSSAPCLNGGTCVIDSTSSGGFFCICDLGFIGQNCETPLNPCATDPCQNGGVCTFTDVEGTFFCNCPMDFTGLRCQFTDVCITQNPCPPDQSCVTTVTTAEGFVCSVLSSNDTIVITGAAAASSSYLGFLDEQVNTLLETQTSNTVRRRRQLDTTDDGFATTCEARFTLRDGATNTYVLVWACPAGGEPPSLMAQEEICRFLFERRLVESCYAPTTAIFTEDQMPLPPARSQFNPEYYCMNNKGMLTVKRIDYSFSYNIPAEVLCVRISFILVETGFSDPLTATEALAVLEATNALERIRDFGYEAADVYRAVQLPSKSIGPGEVAGIIVGVLALLVTILLVLAFLVRRRGKRRKYQIGKKDLSVANRNGSTEQGDSGVVIQNPILSGAVKQNTFAFESLLSLLESPRNQDSSVLSQSVQATSPKMGNSEKRSVQEASVSVKDIPCAKLPIDKTFKHRDDDGTSDDYDDIIMQRSPPSHKDDDGTSDDYDDIIVHYSPTKGSSEGVVFRPPDRGSNPLFFQPELNGKDRIHKKSSPMPNLGLMDSSTDADDDELIYGNMGHRGQANAGRRWESYWKTQTVFQTPAKRL